ncbi:MAG: AmmeMemoRadiSam system protein B [Acidobacteria bacterium]|nr:AmmeMemoRadiSam system protein B [Acidobacteriota bacterium]
MSNPLPRLRMNLDFMPSPASDRPGLLIRDPFQYSDVTLIIPPALVEMLEYFDGERTENDLRAGLFQLTGDLQVGDLQNHLIGSLRNAGFLEDEVYLEMRQAREQAFAAAGAREPAHAGLAYPEQMPELEQTMARYLEGARDGAGDWIGIAAPHVSPEGGWRSYRAAYGGLSKQYADRIFVVLGTSHYGQPEKFGLTRKAWATPWGVASCELSLIEELERKGAGAVLMEDYCHAVEHSIEFQIVFLQYLFGPDIRVLPILCGAYARSIYEGGLPEEDEGVKRFLDALGEIGAREAKRLFWVLGVDMAHMGRRYGDRFAAQAEVGEMSVVGGRDQARIDRILGGDASGYWELIQENRDDLKWCGSSPFYTFLRAMPEARGTLARYEQWNIDPMSVVSFAGIRFSGARTDPAASPTSGSGTAGDS